MQGDAVFLEKMTNWQTILACIVLTACGMRTGLPHGPKTIVVILLWRMYVARSHGL